MISKVFSDFLRNIIMNSKVIIPIVVSITIIIIAFSIIETGTIKENPPASEKEFPDDPKLQKIMEDKIKNDNSEKPYVPKEREWIRSGPFLVDRSEYVLGEKVFINMDNIPENVKGEIRFVKIFNSTHNQPYKSIAFDGSKKQNNFYLPIYPSFTRGFCTSESLVGDWKVVFGGTPFDNLDFKIVNQILPGMENQFEPVC